jgi:hypothetical protein
MLLFCGTEYGENFSFSFTHNNDVINGVESNQIAVEDVMKISWKRSLLRD